jgi:hypothetical protein
MRDKKTIEDGTAVSQAQENDAQPSFVGEGGRIASDLLTDGERIFGDAIKQVATLARKHPLEAVGIGFGVGCLVGLVLGRR